MGQATIIESLGEGLYRVQLDYDLTPLNGELIRLQAAQDAHFVLLLKALQTLDMKRQATAEAVSASNAVLEQWKQALINETQENPPTLEPPEQNDPETGQPWEDTDRAQEPPFLAAINAARAAVSAPALSRNSQLDAAILALMRSVAATGRITHVDGSGYAAAGRVAAQGYAYDGEIGVGEALALGALSPSAAVQSILRATATKNALLNLAYTDAGVAYVYRSASPYSHHWGAIFATPGVFPTTESPEGDPAKTAADESGSALDKITVPTVSATQPGKLSAACALTQRAVNEERAADEAVKRLLVESMERNRRIEKLTALKTASLELMDLWMCRFIEDAPVGATVPTAEVPGYYDRKTTSRITVMNQRNDPDGLIPDQDLSYIERIVNLVPPGLASTGRLRHAEVMSDSAVFVNLALEPGHLKWRPIWRYGTLISVTGNVCSLLLDAVMARGNAECAALPVDETLELLNVPISYPPCHGEVFEAGDAVLVLFEGQQREHPKVVGFRREPRPCPGGRISWSQIA